MILPDKFQLFHETLWSNIRRTFLVSTEVSALRGLPRTVEIRLRGSEKLFSSPKAGRDFLSLGNSSIHTDKKTMMTGGPMRDSHSPSGDKTLLLQVLKSRGPGRSGDSRLDRTGVRSARVVYGFIVLLLAAATLLTAGCAKKQVGVPELTRLDLDQAQKALAAVPLKVGPVANAGPGAYVVQQTPPAGTMVDANSTVNLVVELPVSLPNLVGGSITDAVSTLQGLGLKVAFLSHHTMNPFAKSKVEVQDPAAGTLVHHDTLVRLMVTGPADAEALLNLVKQEPEYKNLNPKYKSFLDLFLADPSTSRSMEPQDAQGSAPVPSAPSAPPK